MIYRIRFKCVNAKKVLFLELIVVIKKRFKKYCESIGIEIIVNDLYMPKQNCKIERFHKTLKREFFWKYCSFNDGVELLQYKYNQWLNYYNTKRYKRFKYIYGYNSSSVIDLDIAREIAYSVAIR